MTLPVPVDCLWQWSHGGGAGMGDQAAHISLPCGHANYRVCVDLSRSFRRCQLHGVRKIAVVFSSGHCSPDEDGFCEMSKSNPQTTGVRQPDGFVVIDKSPRNIDRWLIRATILAALRRSYPLFRGDLIDIGCGKMPYRTEILQKTKVSSYVGLDVERALVYDVSVRPDATWDGVTIPFPDQNFDSAIATEVFEHVPDVDLLLREIRRILRPGSVILHHTIYLAIPRDTA